MAKQVKVEVKTPVYSSKAAPSKSLFSAPIMIDSKNDELFMFTKMNYILMTVGIALIALGFVLMSGGATSDPNVFPKEEIYSARRITVAPIVVLLGFIVELFAIFYNTPKSSVDSTNDSSN